MQKLSERSAGFTDSYIRKMTRVALEHNAINLSQGFPDFDPPQEILGRFKDVAGNGPHQYAITWGAKNFRDAIAAKQERLMNISIDPEKQVLVTCGCTEALIAAMMTVTNPGDKVIVFSPFYENYVSNAILCGAEPIYVSLKGADFAFDEDELAAAFGENPKALILCNPSNPCGKVFSKAELEVIARLAEKHDTYVITDEVYEHIVYAPHKHTYFASLPGMFKRTISCSSLSKTYSVTGWRLGYMIAPDYIIERAKTINDFLVGGAPAPLQEAAMAGLTLPDAYYDDLNRKYAEKKALVTNGLDQIGLTHTNPQGAYYILIDISAFGYESDVEFCVKMAKDVGVAAVPGSIFYHDGTNKYIRIHFAKRDETLNSALLRLQHVKTKMTR